MQRGCLTGQATHPAKGSSAEAGILASRLLSILHSSLEVCGLDKGHLGDSGRIALAADLDLKFGAILGIVAWDVAHCNILAEGGAEGSAGDLTNLQAHSIASKSMERKVGTGHHLQRP